MRIAGKIPAEGITAGVIMVLILTFFGSCPRAGEYPPDAYTWALYRFNGDFQDSSGNDRHLTVENPLGYIQFAGSFDSVFGQALYLSQATSGWTDQTRLYSSELRYPGSGSWTVEALIHVPSDSASAVVATHYSEHLAGHDPYWLGYGGGDMAGWVTNNVQAVAAAMSRGRWHHVAGVYDDSAGRNILYVDGVRRSEMPAAAPENLQDYNVYIGSTWFGLDGEVFLDELRISDVAREAGDFHVIPQPPLVSVALDVNPNTLNLASNGNWVTAYIGVTDGYSISDIELATIVLEDEIEASWADLEGDVLMVKFNRAALQELVEPGMVNLTLIGEFSDGARFEGTDTIRVIDRGGGHSWLGLAEAHAEDADYSVNIQLRPMSESGAGEGNAEENGGGGCFIATAAYGSETAAEVTALRKFRDKRLLNNRPGRALVSFYYRHSPRWAEWLRRHESGRAAVRRCLRPLARLAVFLTE